MSISIGTSTPSSARETHAAWLRLREDCQQLVGHARDRAGRADQDEDRAAVPAGREAIARLEQSRAVTILL
ncbi:hypothetical protein ACTOB_006026 [Actinoplanes oblitus]|uniref:Uncharacterized protein n=1 Tax=Actinoplanes oblitus TaxID=3040509 RepID=A0ABY8W858_9ACTN|nr:hypothetical protein [Actinoplanes oblitus]WIM94026.1 hypothetical protein ACTOB_006026 [Actinoplanes oblitus]